MLEIKLIYRLLSYPFIYVDNARSGQVKGKIGGWGDNNVKYACESKLKMGSSFVSMALNYNKILRLTS